MSTNMYVLINNAVATSGTGGIGEWLQSFSLERLASFIAVVSVLILIIGLIGLCLITGIHKKLKGQKPTISTSGVSASPVGNQNLVDDKELVAVITAAIYASMGDSVPAGGLVVRSIHKVNTRR